jgi:uncharacterized protein
MAAIHQPLSDDELDELDELLFELRPTEALELHRAHGLLAAVATAPTLIPPSTWMPALLGEAPPVQNRAQFVALTNLLFKLYNEINDTLGAGEFCPLDHEDPDALRDWCAGYLEGAKLDARWRQDENLWARIFPAIIVAGDGEMLLGEEHADGTIITDVTPHLERCRAALVDWCQETFDLFATERRSSAPKPATAPRKVGRNEPCPCGSGKKSKRCCAA